MNYHLRTLEDHGLVELVEERKRGNMTERIMQASAASYVISPAAMSALAPDPGRFPDQLSARWLVSLAARIVREVGELIAGATAAGKPLASFAIDSDITFATAADRAAFAGELGESINSLVAKYHNGNSEGGRKHRLVCRLASQPHHTPNHHNPSHRRARNGEVAMSEKFEIRREVVVPGTPEQIWAAISAETAGWMFPSPLEIPADGSRPDSPIIATWEPPRELAIHMQGPRRLVQQPRIRRRGPRREHRRCPLRPRRSVCR